MQKKIIALAIAAAFAAPVAMAADGVTLYGSIDAGIRNVDTSTSPAPTTAAAVALDNAPTNMVSALYNSNRWGIKATEDLGDGMSAMAQIESGFDTASGTGNATGDRGVAVGVSGGFGSVVLGGNQYSTAFKVVGTYDPMAYKFFAATGANLMTTNRYDNDIAYTGKFGGVTLMVEQAMSSAVFTNNNNTVVSTNDGTTSVGVTYAMDSFNVGAAYSTTNVPAALNNNALVVINTTNDFMSIGAGFKFGDGKVSVGYTNKKTGATTVVETNMFGGVSYNVTPKVEVTLAMYMNDPSDVTTNKAQTTRTALGATYGLSKKTKLYAEADMSSTDNATGLVTTDKTGIGFGLSTSF